MMNQVYASSAFPVASPEGRRMGPCPLVPQMKVAMSKHKGLRQENTQLSNCTDYNFLTSISKTLLICTVVDVSFGLEMTRNSMFQRVSPPLDPHQGPYGGPLQPTPTWLLAPTPVGTSPQCCSPPSALAIFMATPLH